MELKRADRAELASYPCADRIGFAKLTTMAFNGVDLRPMRDAIMAKIAMGTVDAGEGLDLSLIAQLLGDKQMGLAVQDEVLAFHRLFRSPCSLDRPKLRVLALAAVMDMGGNTPIEFLLEHSGIELQTLYVVNGVELPSPLPEHDVAIVIASDSEECREALRKIDRVAAQLAAAAAQSAAARRQSRSRQAASAAARHRRPRYTRDRSHDPCAALGFGAHGWSAGGYRR